MQFLILKLRFSNSLVKADLLLTYKKQKPFHLEEGISTLSKSSTFFEKYWVRYSLFRIDFLPYPATKARY